MFSLNHGVYVYLLRLLCHFYIYIFESVRPRFINIRDKKKDESFWWVLKAVIIGKYDHKEERNKSSMMLTPRGSENVSGENVSGENVSDELDIPPGI